LGTPPCSVS